MRSTILAALLLAAGALDAAAAEECDLVKIASLDLEFTKDGRPVIPVTVNDTPRRFVIDTALTHTTLSSETAAALDLRTRRVEPGASPGRGSIDAYLKFNLDGSENTHEALVSSVAVGPTSITNMPVNLWPEGYSPAAEVDGALGANYLVLFDWEFDFPGRKINIFSPLHCPGQVVYWTKDYMKVPFKLPTSHTGRITIPVTLDGKELEGIINTGEGHTLLTVSRAKQIFGLKEGTPGYEPVAPAEERLAVFRYRFKTLGIEGLTVNNPLVYFTEDAAAKAFTRRYHLLPKTGQHPYFTTDVDMDELLLGMNILGKLRIYLSYPEQMLYISAGDAR